MDNTKRLFNAYVEYKCERNGLFRKKFKTIIRGIGKIAYCLEAGIPEKYKNYPELSCEKVSEWDSIWDWDVISREVKYYFVDDKYAFADLAKKMVAEDFLEYCKDRMVTSVVITQ